MALLDNMSTIADTVGSALTSSINPIISGITAGSNIIGNGISAVGQYFTNKRLMDFEREEAEKQRTWIEQQTANMNAWNEEMWNKSNEYNSATSQVQRLKDAGLNPLYYGIDGIAAQPMQAAQASGYDRASLGSLNNPLENANSLGQGISNSIALSKDIQLKNAQIDKLKEDTTSVKLDNDFKDMTMKARAESEEYQRDINKKTAEKIDEEKKQIVQNIKESEERIKSEKCKQLLMNAQSKVYEAQASEIYAMLPYKQMLAEAQTIAQKASACTSYMNALTQKKLLDNGAIDAMINDYKAKAKSAEARAKIEEFKTAVHTGNIFDINLDTNIVDYAFHEMINEFFLTVGIISESIVGPISGLLK